MLDKGVESGYTVVVGLEFPEFTHTNGGKIMTYKTVRNTINAHLDAAFGDLTKADLFKDQGIRCSYVKAENAFKLEGSGLTKPLAHEKLSTFQADLARDLPLTFVQTLEVEYRQDRKNKVTVASALYTINQIQTLNDIPEDIMTVEMTEITEEQLAEAAELAALQEEEKVEVPETVDNPADYTYLFHVRNYNKKELGNLHTQVFEYPELERVTAIVNGANETGGYQLVIERLSLDAQDDASTKAEVVIKRYSAKKYALAQFEVPEVIEAELEAGSTEVSE